MASSKGSDPSNNKKHRNSEIRIPVGAVPRLANENDKVEWALMSIQMRAYLKRFPGYSRVTCCQ